MMRRYAAHFFPSVLELSLQRSHRDILSLVDETAQRADCISGRELSICRYRCSNGLLELLADDHELPAHRLLRPAEAPALCAVPLGDESLDLHRVGKHLRRLPGCFLDYREGAEYVRQQGRYMIRHLRSAKPLGHLDGRIATNAADDGFNYY